MAEDVDCPLSFSSFSVTKTIERKQNPHPFVLKRNLLFFILWPFQFAKASAERGGGLQGTVRAFSASVMITAQSGTIGR